MFESENKFLVSNKFYPNCGLLIIEEKILYLGLEKCKETSSSTQASAEELPSLSKSEKDFYRNLKYYFGGGKVKSRKLSPGISGSFNGSQNEVKSEQKTSCKQYSGRAKSLSTDSVTSSFGQQFCNDDKCNGFPKRNESVTCKDELKTSSKCGAQTEWTSSTEKPKRKKSTEGTSFRAEQGKPVSAADSHLPKVADKGKNKQCTEPESTCSTFQTQESEFRGWKPKDTVRNASSTTRRKHNAPGTRLKRRKSREKIEAMPPKEKIKTVTVPPSSDTAAKCESEEQERTDAVFDLGWLGASFTQLKETGG